MSDHENLMAEAELAIDAVLGDTSVSREQTIESLEELRDHIEVAIQAVSADMERNDLVEGDVE